MKGIKVDLAKAKRCVVCGAKVRNINPRCNTCDPTCTRAKHAGRSRDEQIREEMIEEQQRTLYKRKIVKQQKENHGVDKRRVH